MFYLTQSSRWKDLRYRSKVCFYNWKILLVWGETLVFKGGIFEETLQNHFIKNDTDTSKNGISISDNMMTNGQDKVPSTGSNITGKSVQFKVIFFGKVENFIGDDFALNGQSSWRIYWNSQGNSSWCVDFFKSFCYFIGPKSRFLFITNPAWWYHECW